MKKLSFSFSDSFYKTKRDLMRVFSKKVKESMPSLNTENSFILIPSIYDLSEELDEEKSISLLWEENKDKYTFFIKTDNKNNTVTKIEASSLNTELYSLFLLLVEVDFIIDVFQDFLGEPLESEKQEWNAFYKMYGDDEKLSALIMRVLEIEIEE